MSTGEILVIPKNAQGHLFPCMELCKHLLSRNYQITLIVVSDITSSIPTSLQQSSHFKVSNISSGSDPFPDFGPRQHNLMAKGLETLLAHRDSDSTRPICAVIDHIMSKTQEVFSKFDIPSVVFITSGACWAAVQHAAWVVRAGDMKPGEIRNLPGLPEEMVLKYSDLKQRRHWLPPPRATTEAEEGKLKPPRGPPLPGEPAPWVEEVKSSLAILINTSDDLERPFLDYISRLTNKPVWGVGPLLPDQYWQSSDLVLRDREIRPKRESNYSEDEVVEWLDSKPGGSVIYVSFGSEVSPTIEEYTELAKALEQSTRPFIWVIQRKSGGPEHRESYFPHGLDKKVGKRGLIIHGWAPQLMILSHPSTGGFVSHCGWNSTVESLVRGVPSLAWPIRGDQYYNAKLVVNHLKIGAMVSESYPADLVKMDHILNGMEKILSDEQIRKRSAALRDEFEKGFPVSSLASLDAFRDFANQNVG